MTILSVTKQNIYLKPANISHYTQLVLLDEQGCSKIGGLDASIGFSHWSTASQFFLDTGLFL